MNICIWFQTTQQPWGGGNQFLRSLAGELTRRGHRVTDSPRGNEAIVLLNAHNCGVGMQLSPNRVAYLKYAGNNLAIARFISARLSALLGRRGPTLVHRVDGVACLIRGHMTNADYIQPAVNRLADYTIFQSQYCLHSCGEFGIRPERFLVIPNGVDPEVFYPASRPIADTSRLRLVAVSWSSNPRKGFARLAEISKCSGVDVHFVGNWCPSIDPANVKMLGAKSSGELAEILRGMHALLHASENEPCSNAIIEALASGLPVLYLDSGGNRELAADYGIALTGQSADDVERLRVQHNALRDKVLHDRERFLIPHVATRYLHVFEQAIQLRTQSAS